MSTLRSDSDSKTHVFVLVLERRSCGIEHASKHTRMMIPSQIWSTTNLRHHLVGHNWRFRSIEIRIWQRQQLWALLE